MRPPLSSSQSPLSSVSACGENCACSLAPPLPTARGAAGAPFRSCPKRKRAAPGPKEKPAFGRNFARMCKVAVRGLTRDGTCGFAGTGRRARRDAVQTWRLIPAAQMRRTSGRKNVFDPLLFYCLALRRSQYFRHQCSTGSSFRAFRFTRKGYAASVSGRAANGCAVATRWPGGCGGLSRRADEDIGPYDPAGVMNPTGG